MTHGNPPRTGGAAAFLGRADLIFAIPLRLAHPAQAPCAVARCGHGSLTVAAQKKGGKSECYYK
jgi:hypothetical protein